MGWNRDRSVVLSQVSTRVIMGLGALLAIGLPLLCANGFFVERAFVRAENVLLILPVYYAFCIPAYAALFSLDRLLGAIKRGEVFTAGNVRYLRRISWACVAAAIVLLAGMWVSVTFFALAILAAFFGVVLRVVKNLFAAAVELQDENDYTI